MRVSNAKLAVLVARQKVKTYTAEAEKANADYWKHWKALQFAKARGDQEAEVAMINRLVSARAELADALAALKAARLERRKFSRFDDK